MKKFKQYNESVRDQMTPIPESEIDNATEKTIEKLKSLKDNPTENNMGILINYIIQVMGHGDLFKKLIEDGVIDVVELLYLCLSEYPKSHKIYFDRIKPEILDKIIDYIIENKEKLINVND